MTDGRAPVLASAAAAAWMGAVLPGAEQFAIQLPERTDRFTEALPDPSTRRDDAGIVR